MEAESPNTSSQMPPPPPRVRVPRLTSVAGVRREMSRQYGLHLKNEINGKLLAQRIYALGAIREALRDDDVERRVAAIEESLRRAA